MEIVSVSVSGSKEKDRENEKIDDRPAKLNEKKSDGELEISAGTSNGTNHFGLVRPKCSGPALRWSSLTCLVISVGRTEMSLSI